MSRHVRRLLAWPAHPVLAAFFSLEPRHLRHVIPPPHTHTLILWLRLPPPSPLWLRLPPPPFYWLRLPPPFIAELHPPNPLFVAEVTLTPITSPPYFMAEAVPPTHPLFMAEVELHPLFYGWGCTPPTILWPRWYPATPHFMAEVAPPTPFLWLRLHPHPFYGLTGRKTPTYLPILWLKLNTPPPHFMVEVAPRPSFYGWGCTPPPSFMAEVAPPPQFYGWGCPPPPFYGWGWCAATPVRHAQDIFVAHLFCISFLDRCQAGGWLSVCRELLWKPPLFPKQTPAFLPFSQIKHFPLITDR